MKAQASQRERSASAEPSVFDSFLETLLDPCVILDADARIVATNRLWRELPRRIEAKQAAENPIGFDYLELFRLSLEAGAAEEAVAGLLSVLSGAEQFEMQYIRPVAEGFRWYQMMVRPWRQLGSAAAVYHRDITVEKLSQLASRPVDEEFHALADCSPVLIWMETVADGCTFLNRQWLEFTGVPLEDQLGWGWLDLVYPADRSGLMSAYDTALAAKAEFHAEYRLRYRDGSYRWMSEQGSPRLDTQRNVVGYVGTTFDITEQRRATEEALRATRYARLVKEVSEIANTASTMREALQRSVESICKIMALSVGHALLIDEDEPGLAKPANIVFAKDMARFQPLSKEAAPMTWPGVRDLPPGVLGKGKPTMTDLAEICSHPEAPPRTVLAFKAGLRTGMQLPVVVDGDVEAVLEFASEESLASDVALLDALNSATERLARFFERRRAQITLAKRQQELDASARLSKLVREVAKVSSTATTMRDALQQSLDVICETMGFPVGHAFLIEDDEPNMLKSSHVVHVKDMPRFSALFAASTQRQWPADFGAPGEVMQSGRPVITDILSSRKDPDLYPRNAPALAAGLRTGFHLPVLVDGKVEAIIEFASEESVATDAELAEALMAATERISRYFERRRAQLQLLEKKEELEASAERLFTVAGRLVDSQEEERRRIAREIHDDFTQRLALVSMKIGNLTGRDRTSAPDELDASLEEIRKSTAAVASDLRDLSHHLHPAMLSLVGLSRALQAQCEEFQRIRGIQTTCNFLISDHDASPQISTCLYRVLQEALMNVAKHSGSQVAHVDLTRDGDELVMTVRDTGCGFPSNGGERKGIGLLNMTERVQFLSGTLHVHSSPGKGSEILVRVPAAVALAHTNPLSVRSGTSVSRSFSEH